VAPTLRSEFESQLADARRARDKHRTVVLSTLLSDIRNREIADGSAATDEVVREVINRAVKQRREAADQMRAGDREDLAAREELEIEMLSHFLPPQLDEAEVRGYVREIIDDGVSEPGPLMGRLMPRIKGRFDGREANRIVREELAS
jgi:uncharacterized protein